MRPLGHYAWSGRCRAARPSDRRACKRPSSCVVAPTRVALGLLCSWRVAGAGRLSSPRRTRRPTASRSSRRSRDVVVEQVHGLARTTCSSAPTPGRAPIRTIPDAGGIGSADEVVGNRSDTIMVLAPRARRRRRRCSRSRATCGCRSPAASRPDQLGVQRGPPTWSCAPCSRVARHPDQPLRRGRLRGLQEARRRDRRRRDVLRLPDPRHEHRPVDHRAGCHDARRRRRRWPTPAAATTRSSSTASGRRTRPPTSGAPSASSDVRSTARPRPLLDKIETDPFAAGRARRRGDSVRVDHADHRSSTAATRCSRWPTAASTATRCRSTGKTVGDSRVLELDDGAPEILDYFAGAGPQPEPTAVHRQQS